jgi:hypothetical protein
VLSVDLLYLRNLRVIWPVTLGVHHNPRHGTLTAGRAGSGAQPYLGRLNDPNMKNVFLGVVRPLCIVRRGGGDAREF